MNNKPIGAYIVSLHPPVYVCELIIGEDSIRVGLKKKPCWFHRKMITLCFGFKWRDLK